MKATSHALLVIDMQKAYFKGDELANSEDVLVNQINQLLDASYASDVPTFMVITEHKRDKSTWTLNMLEDDQGFLFHGDDEAELVDGLKSTNAVCLVKTRDSAFHKTTLKQALDATGVETLIICGVSTQSCIYQTAADAYANNYKVMLVTDAISSHDPDFHEGSLKLLEKEYRQSLLSTKEAAKILQSIK